MTPFEIRSIPAERGRRRLYLVQLPLRTRLIAGVDAPVTIAQIDGATLDAAEGAVAALLELPGEGVEFLGGASGETPFSSPATYQVEEDLALSLALIFNGVNSLRSEEKIREIVDGVSRMPAEQAKTWVAMLADNAEGARKALAVYLSTS